MKVPSKAEVRAELARSRKLVEALADQNRALAAMVKVFQRETERLQAENANLTNELNIARHGF